MRFQVPQFIDVEDKIFGPLTLKQFIYVAGAAGVVFIAFALLPRTVAIIIATPIALLGAALAFYRIDNRPFIVILESSFNYITRSRLYLWQKIDKVIEPTTLSAALKEHEISGIPKLGAGKLKEMAWNLDVRDSSYSKRQR